MRFEPKSEDQLKAEFLLPDGEYDFTVTEAEEKQSAKGNDMIALKLTAYTPDGGERTLRDWLMAGSLKLRSFCVGTGLDALYEAGELTDRDCVGRSGKCVIVTRDDKTGQYGPQNAVKNYTPLPDQAAPVAAPKPAPARQAPPATRPAASRPAPAMKVNTGPHQPVTEDDIPF